MAAPVIAALSTPGPLGRRLAHLYADPYPLNAAQARHAAELVEAGGVREHTLRRAALESLRQAVDEPHRADLHALAQITVHRRH
ncbi:hypothetical protein [Nonomuraea sp. NPDC003709]|uniref:hypothetical protein n=1 Tax=Nonomuraea sp. NPDC003709 TaxID=3154450 RepID=UPI0033AD838D